MQITTGKFIWKRFLNTLLHIMDYCPKKFTEPAATEDVADYTDETLDKAFFSASAQAVGIDFDRDPVSTTEEQTVNEAGNEQIPEDGSSSSVQQDQQPAVSQPDLEQGASEAKEDTKASEPNTTPRVEPATKPDEDIYFGLVKTLPDRWFSDIYTPMEKLVLDAIRADSGQLISIPKLVKGLESAGLKLTDPRLQELAETVENLTEDVVTIDVIKKLLRGNGMLMSKAICKKLIIPDFSQFVADVEEYFNRCKANTAGTVASFIPELAKVDPNVWGLSLCSIDGQRFSIGDSNVPFPIQSCCRPILYGMVLESQGSEAVHKFVGQEPGPNGFNLDSKKRPHNAMVNTGSAVICAILQSLMHTDMSLGRKLHFIIDETKKLSGNEFVGFNNSVYMSMQNSSDVTYRPILQYLHENECLPRETVLDDTISLYFKACSVEVHCESLAVIAATLANGGICPITEEKVFRSDVVRDVLSLMNSCGMFDYSGQFSFKIGLPAKSSVSGAIMLVIPNSMGIALWSPGLDTFGNSCRGIQFFEELISEYSVHPFEDIGYCVASKKSPFTSPHVRPQGSGLVDLFYYAANGDLMSLRRLFFVGVNMAQTDYDGRTALHLAAAEGHMDCVKFLLEQCNVPSSPADRWGHVPMGEANTFGHLEVFHYLKNWELEHEKPHRSSM